MAVRLSHKCTMLANPLLKRGSGRGAGSCEEGGGAGARAARAEEQTGKSGKSAGAVVAGVLCASVASELGKSEPNSVP